MADTVTKNVDTGGWDYVCPRPFGCGGGDGTFRSLGWARKEDAVERGKQHEAEHDGEPPVSLHDFRESRGLTRATAGVKGA